MNFLLFHGFLGMPTDWDPIVDALKKDFPKAQFQTLNYLNNPPLSSKVTFEKWGANFLNWYQAEHGNKKSILVGYSLGGRLALHAMAQKPELFDFIFCISTNPGFYENQLLERRKRIDEDSSWSYRFLHDPWEPLLKDWNAQAVFEGSRAEPTRYDADYRRDVLSKCFTNWSLGQQRDFRPLIANHQKKMAWIVGDYDRRYIQMTRDLFQICPEVHYDICPESSHRVIFDNPVELTQTISSHLQRTL